MSVHTDTLWFWWNPTFEWGSRWQFPVAVHGAAVSDPGCVKSHWGPQGSKQKWKIIYKNNLTARDEQVWGLPPASKNYIPGVAKVFQWQCWVLLCLVPWASMNPCVTKGGNAARQPEQHLSPDLNSYKWIHREDKMIKSSPLLSK